MARLAGILPTKPPHQEDSREFGHTAVEKALGVNTKSGPKGLFYALVARLAGILPTKSARQEDSIWRIRRQDSGKGPWGQCEKCPQGPFLRPYGPIGWDIPPPQREFYRIRPQGHKKALGANAKNGPNVLFYGFVVRLAGILPAKMVLKNRATRPSKRPLGPLRKVGARAFSMYRFDPCLWPPHKESYIQGRNLPFLIWGGGGGGVS